MTERLVRDLTRIVQHELAEVSAHRVDEGQPALSFEAQQALAMKTLTNELRRLDQHRVAGGELRLSESDEAQIVSAVLAAATGLGPVDVMLEDESIEEIVGSRFDRLFTYHSNGRVVPLEHSPWATESEVLQWLSFVARTKGRTERQFNAQNPLLVMRLGEGLRLAATRDVSQHVTFALRRNALGKVSLADLVGLGMFPPVLESMFRAFVMAHEMRWVVVGSTAAGKTTFVRAQLNELPPERRVVVIEDTAELDMFDELLHPNVESWEVARVEQRGRGRGHASTSSSPMPSVTGPICSPSVSAATRRRRRRC